MSRLIEVAACKGTGVERDYDSVSAEDARAEFENDGREMDEESYLDKEGSRLMPWTKLGF